ncbi:DNA primase [Halopseudomonas pelagia]|uniref:DNA primase n=1 Tax=Halopseudomonas pelagia TaxID=553151 RepID=UPI00039BD645|nr:DNA primase [Halopseudomonas pelagia]|tara:strand:+ start:205457 stop:207325 length:1869 start_codon:yes stop_codon:yes gene_type:complete
MAGLIPQGFIDDLIGRTDIVEVVGSRLKLKKTGKNFSALCPFHNEKSPSFSVSPDKQFYYCFGCGAGGNALSFVMDFERLDFPQAVEELARHAGVDVPREEQRPGSHREPRAPRQDSPLYALLEQAAAYYRQQLRHHAQKRRAVDYLKQRGLTGQIAKLYDIGFAPPGWDNLMNHLSKDSTEVKALIEAGLVVENPDSGKRYDRFRDRIIFPIRDSRGRTLGFGGRVLGDDKPKYLNSPETPIYHKGRELYGLYEARQQNRQLDDVLVVEGYMDVIALAQHGVTNAVATLGTATSEEHLKRLFRIVNTLVFCFDGDKAGRQAAWRALNACLPVLEDGRHVRFMFLPEGQDPDTLIRSEGQDAFRARMAQQAQALTDYLFRHLSEEANPDTLEGKAHLATLALPLIEQIPGSMLKRLLRQSLEKLTGMDLDSLPPPPPPPASANDYADYQDVETDAWAGNQDYSPKRQPQRSSKPRKTERAGVENPLLNAARTLLHHPQLAGLVTEANQFADEEGEQAQLLVGLIEALQKTPTLSTVQLLARWHGTEMGEQLSQLAEKEWLLNIPDANLEQQFFDTINSLVARQTEQRIEHLLDKSSHTPLTTEEKQQLRELLHRRPAHVQDQ